MTLKRFETFVIVAIIAVIGVIFALKQEPTAVVSQNSQVQSSEQVISNPEVQQVPIPSFKYQGQDGRTALEILKSTHQVETKNFSGIGEFVESINGVRTDSKTNFWAFYVNGRQAPVGAGEYQTKAGEEIEWKIETIDQ